MRHISIKVRMTIWFTVVMVVISSLMLVFVMLMNRNQVTKPPAAQVVSVVTRNADRLEVEHGVLDLSDVDLFRHGVYTQVFDEEGQLLAGSSPHGGDGAAAAGRGRRPPGPGQRRPVRRV